MAYCMDDPPEIYRGAPFTDRKSKFQAYCAKCESVQEVCLFRDTLLEDPNIEDATHNILAWITPDDSGFDDDGEKGAGIQVLKMMEKNNVENCAVMISRWFGGILLHGDRFRDITGAAMKVLRDNNFITEKREEDENEEDKKKNNKKNKKK